MAVESRGESTSSPTSRGRRRPSGREAAPGGRPGRGEAQGRSLLEVAEMPEAGGAAGVPARPRRMKEASESGAAGAERSGAGAGGAGPGGGKGCEARIRDLREGDLGPGFPREAGEGAAD